MSMTEEMKVTTPKLNDIFPNWYNGEGIFKYLESYDVPWKSDSIQMSLDMEYHGNHAGSKLVSPLITRLQSIDSMTDDERRQNIAHVVFNINSKNWKKQYDTYAMEYNPIYNYDMEETMTNDETVIQYGKKTTTENNLQHTKSGDETETPNLTHSKTGSETQNPNLTETETPNVTTDKNDSVFGFNSSSAVNSNSSVEKTTGTKTTATTGSNETLYNVTDTDSGNNTHSYNVTDKDTGSVTDSDSGTDTHTHNYSLHRKGNIGVTTSQKMMSAEHELWLWNFFREIVFPDLDKVCTLQVYD